MWLLRILLFSLALVEANNKERHGHHHGGRHGHSKHHLPHKSATGEVDSNVRILPSSSATMGALKHRLHPVSHVKINFDDVLGSLGSPGHNFDGGNIDSFPTFPSFDPIVPFGESLSADGRAYTRLSLPDLNEQFTACADSSGRRVESGQVFDWTQGDDRYRLRCHIQNTPRYSRFQSEPLGCYDGQGRLVELGQSFVFRKPNQIASLLHVTGAGVRKLCYKGSSSFGAKLLGCVDANGKDVAFGERMIGTLGIVMECIHNGTDVTIRPYRKSQEDCGEGDGEVGCKKEKEESKVVVETKRGPASPKRRPTQRSPTTARPSAHAFNFRLRHGSGQSQQPRPFLGDNRSRSHKPPPGYHDPRLPLPLSAAGTATLLSPLLLLSILFSLT